MSDLDVLNAYIDSIDPPEPESAVTVTPSKPRRHRHEWRPNNECRVCGIVRDPAASRRGASARRRGNDAERRLARRYGGQRVGQYGGAADVIVGDGLVIQSKHGPSYWPRRIVGWLDALPRAGGRTPLVIIGNGVVGQGARSLVVLDERDWRDLHGTAAPSAEQGSPV